MSVAKGDYKKVTTHTLAEMKQNREKISMPLDGECTTYRW